MSKVTRRGLLAGLLTSGAIMAATHADAGLIWFRAMPAALSGSAAPITATIPAIYSSTFSADDQFNGPMPAFSIGPNGTALMLDQSLVSQGGTGVLKDALVDAGVGVGDSSGFGVVNGELMLVDDLQFSYRTSGAARIFRYEQALNGTTIVQPIMLTLDSTQGRIWNGLSPDARRGSLDSSTIAYHQLNFIQADFPLTTGLYVPPQGWAGLTHFVGCPDARRIAGLKKAVSGPPGNLVIHPDLVGKMYIFQQGIGEQIPTNGRGVVPVVRPVATTPSSLVTIDGFDFSGVVVSINTNNFKFTNCYQDASVWQLYQQFPGVNFTLFNCRQGDDGDTDPTHMYIDNIADLIALHGQNGMGIYGRTIIPSSPGSQADPLYNPFTSNTSTTFAYLKDIGTNSAGHQYILLNKAVPTNNPTHGLPAGLTCLLNPGAASDARNPSGGTPMASDNSNVGLWIIPIAIITSMEDCTLDGRCPGYKFGMVGMNFLVLAGQGAFGPASDENGVFRGAQRIAVIGSPQDPNDITDGYMTDFAMIAGAQNNGSHVDGYQNNGIQTLGYKGSKPSAQLLNSVVDDRKRYGDSSYFVDPIVNGQSTNPWFALYGTTKLNHGGQNGAIYDEANNGSTGAPSYGDLIVDGCWLRGGAYSIYVTADNKPPAYFTQTSPAAVALAGSQTVSNENNVNTFPGYIIGENVAFNPGDLPPAVQPHKLYTVAGYCFSFVAVDTSKVPNTTVNLQRGDVLVASGGTLVPSGLGAATFSVASVDGTGKALTLNVVNPGQYAWNTKPSALVIQSAASGSSAGNLSISQPYPVSVLLGDPSTGNLVDTSASSTGTGNAAASPAARTFKQISRGLHRFSRNFVSEQSAITAIRMDQKLGYTLATNTYQVDGQGKLRMLLDGVSIFDTRWLFNAPAGTPTSDPATGASGFPLVYIQPAQAVVGGAPTSISPPPSQVTTLTASAVSATQIRVTFAPDQNARVSPDGGVLNPSGYQYAIRPTGGAFPVDAQGNIVWSIMPAVSASGGNVTAALPDLVVHSQSYDVVMIPVNCYSSPEMAPLQFPANSNVATVIMPAA